MTKAHPGPIIFAAVLTVAASLATAPARTEPCVPSLPDWQVLDFEQKAFMVTAHSTVEIIALKQTADHSDEQRWQLSAASSVANNAEDVVLELAASDGRTLRRSRLSQGRKDQRFKSYEFLPAQLLRERRDPPPKTTLPPVEWPLSSSKRVAYPKLPAGAVITDAYALLLLAHRFQSSAEESAEIVVNTDINFYRVVMRHSDNPAIEVNYRQTGAEKATTGKRATRGVKLSISPIGTEEGKPDFSLLGLSGDMTLLFDRETGLLLQLRGTAPRVGDAEINLRSVTLRDPQK